MRSKKSIHFTDPEEPLRIFNPQEENNSQDRLDWRLTLADLLALLITFFTMLFAMSDFDMNSFSKLSSAKNKPVAIEQKTLIAGESLPYILTIISSRIAENPELSNLSPYISDDRLILSLTADDLSHLHKIAAIFTNLPNRIEIITYQPAKVSSFRAGLKKAADVQEIFTSLGYDKPISIKTAVLSGKNNTYLTKIDVIVLPLHED